MKIAYRDRSGLGKSNLIFIDKLNDILNEYEQMGYTLTLRQLYYQLVSRDIIPNTLREYQKLSVTLGKARMAGLVDWNAIEDRVRVPKLPYYLDGVEDAINDTFRTYRIDRQKYQDCYIEVWVEKDALSNIFYRATSEYHIRLMVNRGYSSISAMHEAYKRFNEKLEDGKDCHILYFGDHDPSGLDMVRDIRERLAEFGADLTTSPIALNQQQIHAYNPPPNPAKITDPRAKWYISEYGRTSWELDALRPDVLEGLINGAIENIIDMEKYQRAVDEERTDAGKLRDIAHNVEKYSDVDGTIRTAITNTYDLLKTDLKARKIALDYPNDEIISKVLKTLNNE